MLAAAYLAVTRAEEAKKGTPNSGCDDELIPVSANEIRRLLAAAVLATAHCLAHNPRLVGLATTPPAPSPRLPLPPPRTPTAISTRHCPRRRWFSGKVAQDRGQLADGRHLRGAWIYCP